MDIIVGGGKYGSLAVEFLRQKGRGFILVDINPNCLATRKFNLKPNSSIDLEGEHFIEGDLRAVLGLLETLKTDFVFPTVPTHLAADLAKMKFGLDPWCLGIDSVLSRLPQAVVLQARRGNIIVSFNRDHDCVDGCSMPVVCPSSGKRRPCTMTELIRFAGPNAFLLNSYSMAPGLGALKYSELTGFFNWARRKREFLVATACECHGVLSAFRKAAGQKAERATKPVMD